MWNKIDKDTYMQKVKGLKPIESFTDPDGTMEFSCGRPQIETIWGRVGTNGEDDTPIVKCEMRKQDRHQEDWDMEYFEYVKPAIQDGVIINMNIDPNVKAEEVKETADLQPASEQATEIEQASEVTGQEESAEEGTT